MFQAEKTQQTACEKFEKISEVAKKGKKWTRRYMYMYMYHNINKKNCFNYLQAIYMPINYTCMFFVFFYRINRV